MWEDCGVLFAESNFNTDENNCDNSDSESDIIKDKSLARII
jgi:hypothetical protein